MNEKPDYVLNFSRPPNTELKQIGGGWYLYEWKSGIDPVTRRSRKISGKCLGRITEKGLSPSRSMHSPGEEPAPLLGVTAQPGVPVFHWHRTGAIRARLQRHFPEVWQSLYVAALLCSAKAAHVTKMQIFYESSFLSVMYPGLSYGPKAVAAILRAVKERPDDVAAFNREREETAYSLKPEEVWRRPVAFEIRTNASGEARASELLEAKQFCNRLTDEVSVAMASEVSELCRRKGIDPDAFRQALGCVTAVSLNGRWVVAPLIRTAARTMERAEILCSTAVLRAILRDCENDRKQHS